MNQLATEIWVSQANIERFHALLQKTSDVGRQRLLASLLEQEEKKLRDRMWVQEFRRRLIRLFAEPAARTAIERLLEDAMDILDAPAGDIRVIDPNGDLMHMVASRGHPQSFRDFFALSRCDAGSACGQAALIGRPVLVQDVERSPIYAGTDGGRIMREAGNIAVQSVPLYGRGCYLIGTLSTHWRSTTRPSPDQERKLDWRINQALEDLAAR